MAPLPVATRLQPGAPRQGIHQPARTLFYVESLEEEEVPGMDFPEPHGKGLVPQEFKVEPAKRAKQQVKGVDTGTVRPPGDNQAALNFHLFPSHPVCPW